MQTSIQKALQNCALKELEKLKKYDWNQNSETNFGYLVGGCIMGIAAVTLVADAGGISQIPDYISLKLEHAQPVMGQFVQQHFAAIMGAGGSIVGAGAIKFFMGLRDEHRELKKRAEHAFNILGHGLTQLKIVEMTYDRILANHDVLQSEIKAESQWISKILASPTDAQAKIIAPTGANSGSIDTLIALKSAYLHGVKKHLVETVMDNTVQSGRLKMPTQKMEMSILDGMLDYYVAADKQVPGLLNKLQFVLSGNPEALKSFERPTELANNAINAIVELKGKQVVHSANAKRERLRGDEYGM
jgi:hypothetical protein